MKTKTGKKNSETVERTFIQDKYNENKTWEIVKLSGGYYLRQYIKGRQFGRGIRVTKKWLVSMGFLEATN